MNISKSNCKQNVSRENTTVKYQKMERVKTILQSLGSIIIRYRLLDYTEIETDENSKRNIKGKSRQMTLNIVSPH